MTEPTLESQKTNAFQALSDVAITNPMAFRSIRAYLDALERENERLRVTVTEIMEVATGERQVAIDDTDGMGWIATKAKEVLENIAELERGCQEPVNIHEYLKARRRTIESSIAAEALAGNEWKEKCERTALAEITALEAWFTNTRVHQPTLTFSDARRIAMGCKNECSSLEISYGINHVINALEAAEKEKKG